MNNLTFFFRLGLCAFPRVIRVVVIFTKVHPQTNWLRFILASLCFHARSIRTRGNRIQMQTEAEQVQLDNLFNTKNTYRKCQPRTGKAVNNRHPEAARKNPDFNFQRKIEGSGENNKYYSGVNTRKKTGTLDMMQKAGKVQTWQEVWNKVWHMRVIPSK